MMMWSQPNITALILGELRDGVPHLLQSCEDGTSVQERARITTENEKDNIKLCVCPLSSH